MTNEIESNPMVLNMLTDSVGEFGIRLMQAVYGTNEQQVDNTDSSVPPFHPNDDTPEHVYLDELHSIVSSPKFDVTKTLKGLPYTSSVHLCLLAVLDIISNGPNTFAGRRGIVNHDLLVHRLETKDRELTTPFLVKFKDEILEMMRRLSLIADVTIDDYDAFFFDCLAVSPDGVPQETTQRQQEWLDKERVFLLPTLLVRERDDSELYPSSAKVYEQTLVFAFVEHLHPTVVKFMFHRLLVSIIRKVGLSKCLLFDDCARFPTDDPKQTYVIENLGDQWRVKMLSFAPIPKFDQAFKVRVFLSSTTFAIRERWMSWGEHEYTWGAHSNMLCGDDIDPFPVEMIDYSLTEWSPNLDMIPKNALTVGISDNM